MRQGRCSMTQRTPSAHQPRMKHVRNIDRQQGDCGGRMHAQATAGIALAAIRTVMVVRGRYGYRRGIGGHRVVATALRLIVHPGVDNH